MRRKVIKAICSLLVVTLWGVSPVYAEETDKQIFISFDHENNYGQETTELLQAHKVLKLGTGENALFGVQWGKKDAAHENTV